MTESSSRSNVHHVSDDRSAMDRSHRYNQKSSSFKRRNKSNPPINLYQVESSNISTDDTLLALEEDDDEHIDNDKISPIPSPTIDYSSAASSACNSSCSSPLDTTPTTYQICNDLNTHIQHDQNSINLVSGFFRCLLK